MNTRTDRPRAGPSSSRSARPRALRTLFLVGLAASLASGCALLSKGDPGDARYFTIAPAPSRPVAVLAGGPAEPGDPAALRLGRVTGAPHLEGPLVFRDSAVEVQYHRELRWTEPPERSLKRLLARALFEGRRLQRVVGGAGPTLDVQLTALDEVRVPKHLARAQVIATLHDEHLVLWEETVTVDVPIADPTSADLTSADPPTADAPTAEEGDPDLATATVEALGEALQATVDRVADRVVRELGERR